MWLPEKLLPRRLLPHMHAKSGGGACTSEEGEISHTAAAASATTASKSRDSRSEEGARRSRPPQFRSDRQVRGEQGRQLQGLQEEDCRPTLPHAQARRILLQVVQFARRRKVLHVQEQIRDRGVLQGRRGRQSVQKMHQTVSRREEAKGQAEGGRRECSTGGRCSATASTAGSRACTHQANKYYTLRLLHQAHHGLAA